MPSEQAIADVQAGLTCTNPIDREDIVRVLENYRDDVEVAITLLNDFGGVPPWMLAEGSAEETAFHQRRREYLESLTSAAVAPAAELPSPVDDMGVKTVVMPTQQDDDDPGCTCDISLPDIDEETRNRCLCGWTLGILSVGILLMVILVPLSFCGVERQYMGFMWNRLTTVDTTKIYENGNHFVGLNRLSLTYPTTYQAICYSSDDLTFAVASGQVISIDLCFHYVIQKAGLADLFRAYGLNFDPRIASIGRSAIKNAAATFVLDQFITDRDTVQAGMLTALRANLASSSVNVSIPVDGFILGQIILPTSVLDRNLAIFEQTQLQVQQGYELTATLTRYDTRANISSINASTTIVLQQATAVANRMRTAATLAGVSTLRGTVGVLIQNMSTRLQVKNATAVATLAKYTLLLSSADRNGGLTAATPGITVVADSLVNIIPQI